MKIKDIIQSIESVAPLAYQESWDNSGLAVGDANAEVEKAMVALDVTEAIIDEAIANNETLIIAHHPLIFGGIKSLTGKNEVERCIIKAIKNNIAIYSAHTNIDVVKNGVSWKMAEKLQLTNVRTLIPQGGILKKLSTFVPVNHLEAVRAAIFEAGAGVIGNYDQCSFNVLGEGTFRGNKNTNPFVGTPGTLHTEKEVRIETIFPAYLESAVVSALQNAHPYEEVAFDIYPIENKHPEVGLGVLGELMEPIDALTFLKTVKQTFNCEVIRHTDLVKDKIKTVALSGGAGSSFLKNAMRAKADIYITGDFKYHQFFEAEGQIIIADIGHYESEQFTKDIFYEIVTNKFPKFALRLSNLSTNPVRHLY